MNFVEEKFRELIWKLAIAVYPDTIKYQELSVALAQSRFIAMVSSFIARRWSGLRLYNGSDVKLLSVGRRLMLICSWTHRVSTWGFLLLLLNVIHEPFSLFPHGVLIWLECFSMLIHCNLEGLHASWTFPVLQQQQNLGRRFGTSKMHLSPWWLRLLSVLRRWFCCCWLFVYCYSHCGESVIVLCFAVRYFMSILVLQSSWEGRESWLLCLICLPGVSWWLSGSSSRCHGDGRLRFVIVVFPDHTHIFYL